jgi:hypothetical protein
MVEKMQMLKLFLVFSQKIYYAVIKNYHTVVKIGNDNTPKDPLNSKHKYTKVIIVDPYNNRDIIARVATKQKEKPSPNSLNPNWVTGFSDAEACFGFRIRKNNKLKIGWEVIPYFFIHLHVKDLPLLLNIKQFFKVGNISHSKDSALYQVNSIEDLITVIIPHFHLFPLISKKKADFLLFILAIELIRKKEHKSIEGIYKLIGIKASLNKGLLEELKTSFPNVVSVERPEVVLPETINPYWFAGFTSGDGCFSVEIVKSSSPPPPQTPPYGGFGGPAPSPPSPPRGLGGEGVRGAR